MDNPETLSTLDKKTQDEDKQNKKTKKIRTPPKIGGEPRSSRKTSSLNNISVISWRSVLLVEETGVPGENHLSVESR